MRIRVTEAILPLMLLLGACSSGGEAPAGNSIENAAENGAEAPAETSAAAQVPSLKGDWSVTAFNGQPLTQVYPMSASFGDDRLTVRSDCVRMAWTYTQDRNIVAFTPAAADSCGRGHTDSELQVERALKLANIAMFTNEGQEVQISGAGGMVTMTR